MVEKIDSEPVCRRCGLCCHLVIDGKLSIVRCKYLVPMGNNRFACRIYKSRLGKDIGYENKCFKRESVHKNYKGCTYNRPEWGEEIGLGDEFEKK